MEMADDNGKMLPPQESRTPSGRRESSTVPGTLTSLSSVGPALLLPTGRERERITVENETELDSRDPLEDCEDELQHPRQDVQNLEMAIGSTPITTPAVKREARKISPDAPSEEETGVGIDTKKIPRVTFRKPRTRKRRQKNDTEQIEDISEIPMTTDNDRDYETGNKEDEKQAVEDSDVECTGTHQLDEEVTRKLRPRKRAADQPLLVRIQFLMLEERKKNPKEN
ncbi:hypothetical protein RF55_9462 [Lasius niger]|uniref:Uncharacterized protein n=1 Tax=Lasius niger TaxID=67767 RepID=A0A0J7KIS9_LASNI|nr:hypothetical protein RF55_9911 [Lasius niger]KMQ90750.1 hypothetical protein RF55_9462 [Lasius niger]